MAGFHYDRIGPLEDAIGELSGWYAFSDAAQQDQARRTSSPGHGRLAYADLPQPVVDPFKGVGRNDPCPCGSGKKFKKCCLHWGALRTDGAAARWRAHGVAQRTPITALRLHPTA